MALLTFKKDSNERLSDHFTVPEFRCPCDHCTTILVDSTLIERLEKMRETLHYPLRINSGYRCSNYQAELRARGFETSHGPSQHEIGAAADVMRGNEGHSTGLELEKAARLAGFLAVGVGGVWVHVDLRGPKERRWVYVQR